ncbi:hypothetical protein LAWI1_G008324 [Lachnellula willkommii]|uniref:Uncharacterized protein n=1 Tax=Lachnellula willkommii TaxID=215461 RepID=A0A559LY65_9HELO|nr:hypothetical protein LAWI1_G008324 [Lachnellula willkommii]
MAPPIATFPASDLPITSQTNLKGTKRKGFDGDLKACALLEMLQYDCRIEEPGTRNSPVRCWPVERLFRRCRDQEGSFMVETTAWERGEKGKKD